MKKYSIHIILGLALLLLVVPGTSACSYMEDPYRDNQYTMQVLDKNGILLGDFELDRLSIPCGQRLIFAYYSANTILVETDLNKLQLIDLAQTGNDLHITQTYTKPSSFSYNVMDFREIIGMHDETIYTTSEVYLDDKIVLADATAMDTGEKTVYKVDYSDDLGLFKDYISDDSDDYHVNKTISPDQWAFSTLTVSRRGTTLNYPWLGMLAQYTNYTHVFNTTAQQYIDDLEERGEFFIRYNLDTTLGDALVLPSSNYKYLYSGFMSINGEILSLIRYDSEHNYKIFRYNWADGIVIDEVALGEEVTRIKVQNDNLWLLHEIFITDGRITETERFLHQFDMMQGSLNTMDLSSLENNFHRMLVTDDYLVTFNLIEIWTTQAYTLATILGISTIAVAVFLKKKFLTKPI